jgi:hypothetical protein
VAGSAAALGALLYGTGAATTWIRLKQSGYPADVAVEHQSRTEMIAVGLRGFALVLGVALGVGLVVLVAARLHARLAPHSPRLARAGEHLRTVSEWAGGALGVLAVIVSAFVSWRLFGIVFTVVAGAGSSTRRRRSDGGRARGGYSALRSLSWSARCAGRSAARN